MLHKKVYFFSVLSATLTLTNGGLDDGDTGSQESFDIQASLKKKKKFTGELPQLVEPSLEHRVLCLALYE